MLQLDAKTKRADAALLRHLRQRDAGLFVDRFGDAFEFLAHRVVGDRREMDDGIDAIEQFRRKVSDIAEMQPIQQRLRASLAAPVRLWAKYALSKPINSASGNFAGGDA